MIILDACRYDYFKEHHSKYLTGKLEKQESVGRHTMEWLDKTFKDKEDIIYVSANPFINSIQEMKDQFGNTFDGKKHFTKVVDAFNICWNEELGTVTPKSLTNLTKKMLE